MMRPLLACILWGLASAAAGSAAPDTRPAPTATQAQQVAALKAAIADRLAVMADVARYKWNEGLAIDAPEREAKVIEATTARAVAMSLDPAVARRAVTAQMEASKALQRSLFNIWREDGTGRFENVPSLRDSIRPRIDSLTGAFLSALGGAGEALTLCSMQGALLSAPPETDTAVWQIAAIGVLPTGACTPDAATRE